MKELLVKLGIQDNGDIIDIKIQLEEKQLEYLEKLSSTEDENIKVQIKNDLEEIKNVLKNMAFMIEKANVGITLEEKTNKVTEEDIDFDALKKIENDPIVKNYIGADSVEEKLDKAVRLIDEGDYKNGIPLMKELADQGIAGAQVEMGFININGKGVEKDSKIAESWFRKAAEQGDAFAQQVMGVLYKTGDGVPLDYEKAADWFKKAAELGNHLAQYNLAICYRDGEGVPQSYEKAKAWYEKAAEQGFDEAQSNLGYLYDCGLGVEQDYDKAAEWYLKAAEQGLDRAQHNMGYLYANGKGVNKNYDKAVVWYQKAADQGYVDSMVALGYLYEMGKGIPRDYSKAFQNYYHAAEAGDEFAQYDLARFYIAGKGVGRDLSKAEHYLKLSMDQGNKNAFNYYNIVRFLFEGQTHGNDILKAIYIQGIEFLKKENYTEALKYFFAAAESDFAPAAVAATFVEFGTLLHNEQYGVEPSVFRPYGQLYEYLEAGCYKGDEACTILLGACLMDWSTDGDGLKFIDDNGGLSQKYGDSLLVSVEFDDILMFPEVNTQNIGRIWSDALTKIVHLHFEMQADTQNAMKLYKLLIEKQGKLAGHALSFINNITEDNTELWGREIYEWAEGISNKGNVYAKAILANYYQSGIKPVVKSVDTAARLAREAGNIPQAQAILRNLGQASAPQPNNAALKKKSGGCYVATSVYGSYDCPEVWTLRRFRDEELAKTWYGRSFIRFYYGVSPTVVKWFGKREGFQQFFRKKLDKLVIRLKCQGFDDKPYEDRNW